MLKVLCVNADKDHPAAMHFLEEGKTYTVEDEVSDGIGEAYVLEEIKETCACCGERLCFDKESFIPIQDIEEVIKNEEENS